MQFHRQEVDPPSPVPVLVGRLPAADNAAPPPPLQEGPEGLPVPFLLQVARVVQVQVHVPTYDERRGRRMDPVQLRDDLRLPARWEVHGGA